MKTLLLHFIILFTVLHADTFESRMTAAMTPFNTQFKANVLDCFDGNAKACLEAGQYYSAEAYKIQGSTQEQIGADVATFYKKACQLGSAQGCTAYAMIYAADTQKDPDKDARYYFQKGCDGGDFSACTMLNMMPAQE